MVSTSIERSVLTQFHHRALAELTLDLGERAGQGLGLVHGGSFDDTQGSGGHWSCSLWRGFARGTNGGGTGERLMEHRTLFVLGSQYVLFEGRAELSLAPSNGCKV